LKNKNVLKMNIDQKKKDLILWWKLRD